MISIVMAYYNRKKLLLNTLDSIYKIRNYTPFEIIVVDDGSNEENSLDDVKGIRLIKIPKEKKSWVNSCVPYNVGFKECNGDIIIIQNPECMHNGDILTHAKDNVNGSNYITYGCYSLPNVWGMTIQNRTVVFDGDEGWYNHSKYRPVSYHFCSAITKKNLEELGGFDERYKDGIDYDDNEFLTRVKRKGLNISIVDNPFVYHQYHYTTGYRPKGKTNKDLYFNITLKENRIKVNENTIS